MHLAMAVHAVFTQHILVSAAAGQPLSAIWEAGVESRRVALLAQGRTPRGEQTRLHGAVGSVTEAAIFSHGWMLPEKRAAFVLVTTQAVIV